MSESRQTSRLSALGRRYPLARALVRGAVVVAMIAAWAVPIVMAWTFTPPDESAGSEVFAVLAGFVPQGYVPPPTGQEPFKTLVTSGVLGPKGEFVVQNMGTREHAFLLIALQDFEQSPFRVDGQEVDSAQIRLSAGDGATMTVDTPELPPGVHEVTWVLFWAPDATSLDRDFRVTTDDAYFTSDRTLTSLGGAASATSTVEPAHASRQQPVAVIEQSQNFGGVMVSGDATWTGEYMLGASGRAGAAFNSFVHVGNPSGSRRSYVLVGFLDFEQVAMWEDGEGRPARSAVVSVPAGSIGTFAMTAPMPAEVGSHELVVMAFPLGELSSMTEPDQAQAMSSVRIPVQVEQ